MAKKPAAVRFEALCRDQGDTAMSIRVMTAIWETCLYNGNRLVVLLALADWANDEGGRVFPSLETLAGKARLTVRTAQHCLRRLQKDGVILSVGATRGGRGKVTEYKINLERVNYLQGLHRADVIECKRCNKRCIADANNGEKKIKKGEKACPHIDKHQDPSVNPSYPSATPDIEWAELWQVFKSWPGLSAGASEQRAKDAWRRIRHELPQDLKQRVAAHCLALERENAVRGRAGKALVVHPHNWLERDRGWERYGSAIGAVGCGASELLWSGEAAKLVRLIGTERFCSWFQSAQFEPGPPVTISLPKLFQLNYVEKNFMRELNQAFGEVVVRVQSASGLPDAR